MGRDCPILDRDKGMQTLVYQSSIQHSTQHESNRPQEHNGANPLADCEDPSSISTNGCLPNVAREQALSNHVSSDSFSKYLLTHFQCEVAPRLAWIDGPNNAWRNLVLPLSRQSLCLRLSILSLSATHLSVTSPTAADLPTMLKDRLRDASLRALNTRMRCELHRGNMAADDVGDTRLTTELLATMLVLCHGEMLAPGSTDWNLHLRACRAVIERGSLVGRRKEPGNAITSFLTKEVVDLESFGSLASFSGVEESNFRGFPAGISNNGFWTFTDFIHEVTTLERKRYGLQQQGRMLPDPDMTIWRTKLDHAYTLASARCSELIDCDEVTCNKFASVVRAHCYAGIIYSHQALLRCREATKVTGSLLGPLLHEIELARDGATSDFDHDVFWPLFIAGTECGPDEEKQSIVQVHFIESITATGFWCNYTALQFLRAFWSRTDKHRSEDWIQYARGHQEEIGTFLVF